MLRFIDADSRHCRLIERTLSWSVEAGRSLKVTDEIKSLIRVHQGSSNTHSHLKAHFSSLQLHRRRHARRSSGCFSCWHLLVPCKIWPALSPLPSGRSSGCAMNDLICPALWLLARRHRHRWRKHHLPGRNEIETGPPGSGVGGGGGASFMLPAFFGVLI